ncbi:MAG: hypothetical protein V4611_00325 [Patescibacteria group bacterium]
MVNKTQKKFNIIKNKIGLLGLIAYIAVIILSAIIMASGVGRAGLFEVYLVLALIISGLGIGFYIAGDAKEKVVSVLGTILFSILLVFPGFFLSVILGWTIGVSFF